MLSFKLWISERKDGRKGGREEEERQSEKPHAHDGKITAEKLH
jgi:hypothetical protein